jgi:hypothetical protein
MVCPAVTWNVGDWRRQSPDLLPENRARMTTQIRQSVASGKPYPVTAPPCGGSASLDLFLGDAEFTIEGDLLIRGHGVRHGDLVRFHEKDHLGGKDVRVWLVSQRDGVFMAESVSAF